MRQCNESPPGQLLLGIRQFNNREWYECHETLEELWIGESGEVRDLYQGTLQLAVALHHWRNGNFGGAVALLAGGAELLQGVSDACLWIDVARLIADANRMRQELESLGQERMALIGESLIPRITTVSAE